MPTTHKFFRDKVLLILLGFNYFLAFFSSVVVALRLTNSGQSSNYFIQYRSNLGISAFTTGGVTRILYFIIFAGLILVISTALSIKAYHIKRELSVVILSFGILLLLMSMVVSNLLLALR